MLSFLYSCAQTEESTIEDTCNRFINGRKALKRGDATDLKLVTSDSLFKLIKLNQDYVDIIGARVIEADLNIRVKSVEIKDSCATCLMTSMQRYVIQLCKEGDAWKVQAENDMYPTTETY